MNKVGVTRLTYSTLVSPPNDRFYEIQGWAELEKKLSIRPDDEHLVSLYIQHRKNGSSKTFYFDNDGSELLV